MVHCQHAGLGDPGKLSCPWQQCQPSNLRPVPSMKKSMRPLGMPQPQHSCASSLLMDLTNVSLTPTVSISCIFRDLKEMSVVAAC